MSYNAAEKTVIWQENSLFASKAYLNQRFLKYFRVEGAR